MRLFSFVRADSAIERDISRFGWLGAAAVVLTALGATSSATQAQQIDCGQLRAQIAQMDRGGGGGNRYAGAARRQAADLARAQANAQRLGCSGGFMSIFGGGNPQCGGLQQRIAQMQANLSALQAAAGGGGGSRNDLVQRFNAYCRGGQEPQRPRGFFESLFGGSEEPRQPLPQLPLDQVPAEDDGVHGGGQAVCVRTCDGSFFPLGLNARHKAESLNEMCSALCPGAETAVYTRRPDAEIKTAVGLDGKPYSELPNALKFQKEFTPACSCRPAGKSWAETLANAEDVLGNTRKTDIMVTPEKSDELSRPKLDAKTRGKLLLQPNTTKVSPQDADKLAADPGLRTETEEVTGPDGSKRLVRRVGPQN